MDLCNLLYICKVYRDLGGAVQDQLDEALDDTSAENLDEQNPNALDTIATFLEKVALEDGGNLHDEARDYADMIREYLEARRKGMSTAEQAAAGEAATGVQ